MISDRSIENITRTVDLYYVNLRVCFLNFLFIAFVKSTVKIRYYTKSILKSYFPILCLFIHILYDRIVACSCSRYILEAWLPTLVYSGFKSAATQVHCFENSLCVNTIKEKHVKNYK